MIMKIKKTMKPKSENIYDYKFYVKKKNYNKQKLIALYINIIFN